MKRDVTMRFDPPPDGGDLSAPACIVQIYGEPLGRRVELGPEQVTVGRDEDNTVPIDLTTVSRRHARLWQEDKDCWLEDLGSTNGSLVNGEEASEPVRLGNGDLINFGGAVFKFIEGGNVESLYHEEIHRIAITDGLTQIANRRHFMEFLSREISRAQRHARPLCLAMFDVDHFKRVNDEHGHVAGDLILKGISTLVGNEVRSDELLARFGGEEFAVVLPEAEIDQARQFCERARTVVADTMFEAGKDRLKVTISLGATQLQEGMSAEDLIAATDERLYEAKRNGRNRTVAH